MRRARFSIARAIVAASLVLGDVAVAGAQSHDPAPATTAHSSAAATSSDKPSPASAEPASTSPEKPKLPAPPPDMKTVVERIQKRIEEEVTRPEAARRATTKKPAASRRVAAAPPPKPDGRVHLTWRASLVWPEDLTDRQ
ncbi:MAG TPA: hypothetical protein VG736_04985 [Vicinamibacterales bacterium]|jgi:hypothetical protein|nr:hypothetical protein [Vicinamibacterales bacterium]